MSTKSFETKQYILEKIAPIFNKNGYAGTSLSDVTKATGLTKGAIYGNFKDKEEILHIGLGINDFGFHESSRFISVEMDLNHGNVTTLLARPNLQVEPKSPAR